MGFRRLDLYRLVLGRREAGDPDDGGIASGGARLDAESLAMLEVLTPDGRKLPASQLGRLEVRFEEPVIKRYNREPELLVQADVAGAQPNDVTAAVWKALEGVRSALPPGYSIMISGAVEQSAKADASIQALQPLMVAVAV